MEKTKLGPQPLLCPLPAVLVGTTVNGKPTFMVVAWCGIASFNPPAVMIGVHKGRYTLEGINQHGTFSINIPSVDLAEKVDFCGIYSGKETDKSRLFKTFYGSLDTAPLIEECPVNLECEVKHSLDLGSHTALIAEIKETHVNENCMTAGKPDTTKIDPLMFALMEQQYQRQGEFIGQAFQIGKK